jgi:hypothetical protein
MPHMPKKNVGPPYTPLAIDANLLPELTRTAETRGTRKSEMMSRLVQWFLKQDDLIKTAIMGSLSPAELARLAKTRK